MQSVQNSRHVFDQVSLTSSFFRGMGIAVCKPVCNNLHGASRVLENNSEKASCEMDFFTHFSLCNPRVPNIGHGSKKFHTAQKQFELLCIKHIVITEAMLMIFSSRVFYLELQSTPLYSFFG